MRGILIVVGLILVTAVASFAASDVSGDWSGHLVAALYSNETDFMPKLNNRGGKLAGTFTFCGHACDPERSSVAKIENGKTAGARISFSVETGEPDVPRLDFTGSVTGNLMKLSVLGKSPTCPGAICKIGEGSATRSTSPR
jgi:hypothetical protein